MLVEWLKTILLVTDVFVVVYLGVYLLMNFVFLFISAFHVRGLLRRRAYVEPGQFTPKFSLLVPAYNEEVTIAESLKSPAVPSWSKVKRLVLVDKENGGKADALNAGINMAEGVFVSSMDADSSMLPQTLTHVLQPLLDDPTDLVAVGIQVAASNGSTVREGRLEDAWVCT